MLFNLSTGKFVCRLIFFCLGLSIFTQPARAQKSMVASTLSNSPWQIQWEGPTGLTLSYDGVPLIRQSSLYVVKPGWTGLLFDGRRQKYETTRDKGEQPKLTVSGDNEFFRAQYRFEVLDARRFRLHFRGELKSDVPASIEYAAGYFNANLLANRPFRASTEEGAQSGIVPTYPVTGEQLANDLAPNFRTLEFDSRIGKLSVETRSETRILFFDARREAQSWARPAPIFWCGWLAGMQPLKFGQPVELEMLLTIDPLPLAPGEQAAARPQLRRVPDAQSARKRPLQIIPRPQKLQISPDAPFQLKRDTRVSITVPRGETRLTRAAQKLLREEWHLTAIVPRVREHADSWARIEIGQPSLHPFADRDKELWWRHKEGYFLRTTRSGIEIMAPSPQGAFYGLQTLAQLLGADKGGALCRAVTIEDWPSLSFRGAHWFPSASGVPFHKKMIERILARTKFNACVIQCEAARWDTNPKMAAPNSISKSDLRELVELCRENFIEPIPLINMPGHAEWMFRNKQNLDLAEDPQTPYAYAVNNPKSLVFAQQIMGEALEVFQPKYFHLGHDEVTMRGRFPNPENPFYQADKSAGDLVLENLNRLHAWLQKRGVQTMIWGDMLLAKEEGVDAANAPDSAEARRRRALVPRDVIVTDWHYGSNQEYPSLDIFKKAGLQTIAATWSTPLNIRFFTRAAVNNGARGVLQTTWAGYFPDQSTLKSEASQFAAFILAGDYAWSNRNELPSALPYDPISEWPRAVNDTPLTLSERSGALVDLSMAARVEAHDWLQLGSHWDLSDFFNNSLPGSHRYDDVLFDVSQNRLIVLASPSARDLAPAGALQQFTIETKREVREIAFLNAGLWPAAPGTLIARMLVDYNDGTQSTLDLTQNLNTSVWQADAGAPEARRGWTALPDTAAHDVPFALRVTRWKNPHPTKTIARLRFEAVSPETGWVLAGLTLID